MNTIEALVVTRPGDIAIEHRPRPVPGPGEALVAPLRIGICGTDYHIFGGNQPFLDYPRIMGHELAVELIKAPAGSSLKPGDIHIVNPYIACGNCIACRKGKPNCCTAIAVLGVHRDGGMAELFTLPSTNLIPAQGLTADECAMVEFLAIGAHAVRRAAVSDQDTALVIGAGPIGLGTALFAALAGGTVTLVDRDMTRLLAVERLIPGANIVSAEDKPAIMSGTEEGYDVVFDATGSRASIEAGFEYVAHGGRYTLVSVVKGDISFVDADFHRKELTLLGSRNAVNADFETVIAAIKQGHAKASDWITHRTSLHGAVTDLPRWANDRSGLIKAVVEIG